MFLRISSEARYVTQYTMQIALVLTYYNYPYLGYHRETGTNNLRLGGEET